jgi:hypothetical protein
MTEKKGNGMLKNYFKFLINYKKSIAINLIFAFLIFFIFESTKIQMPEGASLDDIQNNMNIGWITFIGTVFIFFLPILLIGNLQSTINKDKKLFTLLKVPVRLKTYVYSFFPVFTILLTAVISANIWYAVVPENIREDLSTSFNTRGELIEQLKKPEITQSQKEIIANDINETENHMANIFPTTKVIFLAGFFIIATLIPTVLFSNIYVLMFDKDKSVFQDLKTSFLINKSHFWKISLFLTLSFILGSFSYYFSIGNGLALQSVSNSLFYVIITTSVVFVYNNFKEKKG